MKLDDIALALQAKPIPLDIPALPGLHVRAWTLAERIEFAQWRRENDDQAGLCAKLFALSACNSDGVRVCGDSPEELATIQGLKGDVVQTVAELAAAINGLLDDPKA